jgi:hypothetical protein
VFSAAATTATAGAHRRKSATSLSHTSQNQQPFGFREICYKHFKGARTIIFNRQRIFLMNIK